MTKREPGLVRRGLGHRVCAAAAAVALILAGCTDSGSATGDSGTSGDKVTLTLWQYYGTPDTPTGGPLYELLDRYHRAHPRVTVKTRFIPFEDFNRTLLQAAAGNDLPDLALVNAFDTATMADAGVIQDLSDRVEAWGEQDAYFPTSWETAQAAGKTYGIPHVADAYAVYYNKFLLGEAGLTPPRTWEEMESHAKQLSVGEKHGLAMSGIEGAEGATGLVIRTLAAGGNVDQVDSAAGRAALDQFKRMVDEGAMSKGMLTWNEEDAKNEFANGRAAMMINSATYVSVLREENPGLKWGVALLPEDQLGSTFLSAENLTISATSEHSDDAWDVITYMQEPEVLAEYLPERNKLAARDDVPGSADDPVRQAFSDQLEQAWAPEGKVAARSAEVFTHIQGALQGAVSGSASVEDALRDAQAKIDESLAE